MKTFDLEVSFTFTGKVTVAGAQTAQQAREIAQAGFGLNIGELHSNDTRIKDWNFDSKALKVVGVTPIKK